MAQQQQELPNQQQELVDQWSQFSRQALESYRDLGEIQVRIFNRLLQQQLELANAVLEGGLRQLNLLYQPETYRELVEKQTELASDFNEQLATVARRTNDVLVEANNKFTAWADRSIRTVSEQVRETAEQAQRTARQAQQAASESTKKSAA